jgi:hypothetical protein
MRSLLRSQEGGQPRPEPEEEWAFASSTTPGVKKIVKVAASAATVTAVIAFAVMDLNM